MDKLNIVDSFSNHFSNDLIKHPSKTNNFYQIKKNELVLINLMKFSRRFGFESKYKGEKQANCYKHFTACQLIRYNPNYGADCRNPLQLKENIF